VGKVLFIQESHQLQLRVGPGLEPAEELQEETVSINNGAVVFICPADLRRQTRGFRRSAPQLRPGHGFEFPATCLERLLTGKHAQQLCAKLAVRYSFIQQSGIRALCGLQPGDDQLRRVPLQQCRLSACGHRHRHHGVLRFGVHRVHAHHQQARLPRFGSQWNGLPDSHRLGRRLGKPPAVRDIVQQRRLEPGASRALEQRRPIPAGGLDLRSAARVLPHLPHGGRFQQEPEGGVRPER